jgi:uncharacterized protein YjiS (DUF1127 family)
MAFADFTPARPAQVSIAGAFHVVVQWVSARRAKRAREATLQSLLFAPETRLQDIGISREQLIQAMEIHRR